MIVGMKNDDGVDAARDSGHDTSLHVRRARRGEPTSVEWLIARFTPLLLGQARYRLGPGLRHVYEPVDLVNDVWAIVLPKLGKIEIEEAASASAIFVRFLATTLLNRFRNVLRSHMRKRRHGEPASVDVDALANLTSGIVTRVVRMEATERVVDALGRLDETDRAVVVLRGVEQAPVREVGALLGLEPNTISVRYRRALERLREMLGPSVVDDLPSAGNGRRG